MGLLVGLVAGLVGGLVGYSQEITSIEFTSWSTGATLSYALTPVWSLSMRYQYRRRDSDVPAEATFDGTRLGGSFDENRVTFSLTAAFPIF